VITKKNSHLWSFESMAELKVWILVLLLLSVFVGSTTTISIWYSGLLEKLRFSESRVNRSIAPFIPNFRPITVFIVVNLGLHDESAKMLWFGWIYGWYISERHLRPLIYDGASVSVHNRTSIRGYSVLRHSWLISEFYIWKSSWRLIDSNLCIISPIQLLISWLLLLLRV
jgi:hypothetical protein